MRRRVYMLVLTIGFLVSPAIARQGGPSDSANLKVRQKAELRALKLKQQYARSSLEYSGLPKAVRVQLKHELKREQRDLRQRQKEERQTLKDRERVLKLDANQSPPE